jgi:hypothetical protein
VHSEPWEQQPLHARAAVAERVATCTCMALAVMNAAVSTDPCCYTVAVMPGQLFCMCACQECVCVCMCSSAACVHVRNVCLHVQCCSKNRQHDDSHTCLSSASLTHAPPTGCCCLLAAGPDAPRHQV